MGANFMATTLQPGERRLPSSEELTLMSQLVALTQGRQQRNAHRPGQP